MLGRALDAGVPAAGVTGDEVYGANPALRAGLRARSIGYVLAVACDHPVRVGSADLRADTLLARVPARAWQQVSCGTGAKGHRYYDWAFIRLDHDPGPGPGGQHGQHWLLVRRNQRTGEPGLLPLLDAPPGAHWPSWCGSPGPGGRCRSTSRPARACVAWTSISSAAGAPGIDWSRWPCSPTPSWWWP